MTGLSPRQPTTLAMVMFAAKIVEPGRWMHIDELEAMQPRIKRKRALLQACARAARADRCACAQTPSRC